MYLDSENWLKGSIEYENTEFQHLGSVVTNNGYSDWATTEIPASVKSIWYRLSRREDDYCIECSEDGIRFKQMRVCHIPIWSICLFSRGFFFQSCFHRYEIDRVYVEST